MLIFKGLFLSSYHTLSETNDSLSLLPLEITYVPFCQSAKNGIACANIICGFLLLRFPWLMDQDNLMRHNDLE